MSKNYVTLIKKIISIFIVFFILAYVFKYIYLNWHLVKDIMLHANLTMLFISVVVLALHMILNIKIWQTILKLLGENLDYTRCFRVWAYSQLGRYVPGKVWMIFGRIYLSEKEGLGRKNVFISIYLELLTSFIAAFLLSLFIIRKFYFTQNINSLYMALIIIAVLIFLTNLKLIQNIINYALTRLKRTNIQLSISYKATLGLICLYTVSWLLSGIGLYLQINSISQVTFNNILIYSGIITAAWIIGLLSIFAPSGIGVREGVLTFLLSFLLPVHVAAIIAVISRLLYTITEMIFALIARLMPRPAIIGER